MTVYEAKTFEGIKKICEFISNQPESSLPWVCWHRGHGILGHSEGIMKRYLETLKEEGRFPHIFWAEDGGKVRCVMSVERVQPLNLVTYAWVVLDNKDFIEDNGTYFKELLTHLFRVEAPKYGLVKGEFIGMEKYMKWTKELCGDFMEITHEAFDPILGKCYRYNIDLSKLELKK